MHKTTGPVSLLILLSRGVLVATFCTPSLIAQNHSHSDIPAALRAARETHDAPKAVQIYAQLPSISIRDASDINTLFDELKRLESAYPDDHQAQLVMSAVQGLSKALAQCSQTQHHGTIARLLKKADPGSEMMQVLLGKMRSKERFKAGVRMATLQALLTAAGNGKNHQALPALRSIFDREGYSSQLAAEAIAKIGQPEDLERFIKILEKDHDALINLAPFGAIAITRIIKEVEDPSIPEEDKNQIIGTIAHAGGHESMQLYLDLIHHKNKFVSRVAAESIARVAEPTDEELLKGLLSDADRDIRYNALRGLNKNWNPALAPIFISVLQNDPNDLIRGPAASFLGDHRVCEAEPALRRAESDGSGFVRGYAKSALAKLKGEQNALPARPVIHSPLPVINQRDRPARALAYLRNGTLNRQWFSEIDRLNETSVMPFLNSVLADPAPLTGMHRTRFIVAAAALWASGERQTVYQASDRLLALGDNNLLLTIARQMDGESAQYVVAAGQRGPAEHIRFTAGSMLAAAGYQDEAFPFLADLVENGKDSINRHNALRILWQVRDDRARGAIERATRIPDLKEPAERFLKDWIGDCPGAK